MITADEACLYADDRLDIHSYHYLLAMEYSTTCYTVHVQIQALCFCSEIGFIFYSPSLEARIPVLVLCHTSHTSFLPTGCFKAANGAVFIHSLAVMLSKVSVPQWTKDTADPGTCCYVKSYDRSQKSLSLLPTPQFLSPSRPTTNFQPPPNTEIRHSTQHSQPRTDHPPQQHSTGTRAHVSPLRIRQHTGPKVVEHCA